MLKCKVPHDRSQSDTEEDKRTRRLSPDSLKLLEKAIRMQVGNAEMSLRHFLSPTARERLAGLRLP